MGKDMGVRENQGEVRGRGSCKASNARLMTSSPGPQRAREDSPDLRWADGRQGP